MRGEPLSSVVPHILPHVRRATLTIAIALGITLATYVISGSYAVLCFCLLSAYYLSTFAILITALSRVAVGRVDRKLSLARLLANAIMLALAILVIVWLSLHVASAPPVRVPWVPVIVFAGLFVVFALMAPSTEDKIKDENRWIAVYVGDSLNMLMVAAPFVIGGVGLNGLAVLWADPGFGIIVLVLLLRETIVGVLALRRKPDAYLSAIGSRVKSLCLRVPVVRQCEISSVALLGHHVVCSLTLLVSPIVRREDIGVLRELVERKLYYEIPNLAATAIRIDCLPTDEIRVAVPLADENAVGGMDRISKVALVTIRVPELRVVSKLSLIHI